MFYGSVQPEGHLWTPLPLYNRVIGYILLLRKKVVLKNKQDYLSKLAINGRKSVLL